MLHLAAALAQAVASGTITMLEAADIVSRYLVYFVQQV